ncbi:hypothetical protein L873DRAFT_1352345 [Choiromyces venosus 120613-1]|uniref:NmrA-like domain-containing protein n=1 Tax=Choiromyces venosus 120613-1 TaxID=1336337 RepID=A0A3N4K289_9PEZI|nr:hypothetical protein L873DRAFT_1352345 [Choiromyces venosus 120613-1]
MYKNILSKSLSSSRSSPGRFGWSIRSLLTRRSSFFGGLLGTLLRPKLKRGVEVVQGGMGDKDSLRVALKGSHSVFLVTSYYETLSAEREIQ